MFEIIQDKNMERSVELAKMMQKQVCASTGRQDMGVHQDNLAVLRLTSMPACLLELGFISTPDEEAFLATDEAVERYARGIYNAFVQYKNKYDLVGRRAPMIEILPVKQPAVKEEPKTQPKAEEIKAKESQDDKQQQQQTVKPQTSEPVFKVQIVATSKPLSKNSDVLKGLDDVDSYMDGNFIKYTVGASTDFNKIAMLRKNLLERFPQAFVIAFKDGKRIDTNEAIRIYKANRNK